MSRSLIVEPGKLLRGNSMRPKTETVPKPVRNKNGVGGLQREYSTC